MSFPLAIQEQLTQFYCQYEGLMFIDNVQSIINSDENIKSIIVPEADYESVRSLITSVTVTKHDSHLVIFLDEKEKIIEIHNISR